MIGEIHLANRTRSLGVVIGVASVIAAFALSTGCRRETTAAAQATAAGTRVTTRMVAVPVDGMICQVCAGSVKRALNKVDGVQEAEISLAQRHAVIRYDGRKVNADRLAQAIRDAGFKPGAPTAVQSRQ